MLLNASGPVVDELYLLMVGHTCHYIVGDKNSLILIDPGLQCHVDPLLERMQQLKLRPEAIQSILITHLHADRAGGLALFRKKFPNIKFLASQAVLDILSEPDNLASLHQQDAALQEVYSDITFSGLSLDEFKKGFVIDQVVNESTLIEVTERTKLKPFPIPGHTKESLGYFVDPQQYFIVDEGFGYFRPRQLAAPGSDQSIEDSVEVLERLTHFEIAGLCLPQTGVLSGDLGSRHRKEILQNTRDLIEEVRNAQGEKYPADYIFEHVRSAFYELESPDPLVRYVMNESLQNIWEQLQGDE